MFCPFYILSVKIYSIADLMEATLQKKRVSVKVLSGLARVFKNSKLAKRRSCKKMKPHMSSHIYML